MRLFTIIIFNFQAFNAMTCDFLLLKKIANFLMGKNLKFMMHINKVNVF